MWKFENDRKMLKKPYKLGGGGKLFILLLGICILLMDGITFLEFILAMYQKLYISYTAV